jgi:hypothetical protein
VPCTMRSRWIALAHARSAFSSRTRSHSRSPTHQSSELFGVTTARHRLLHLPRTSPFSICLDELTPEQRRRLLPAHFLDLTHLTLSLTIVNSPLIDELDGRYSCLDADTQYSIRLETHFVSPDQTYILDAAGCICS